MELNRSYSELLKVKYISSYNTNNDDYIHKKFTSFIYELINTKSDIHRINNGELTSEQHEQILHSIKFAFTSTIKFMIADYNMYLLTNQISIKIIGNAKVSSAQTRYHQFFSLLNIYLSVVSQYTA